MTHPLLQTDCLYDEFWKALKQFRVWCKSYSWCDVLESKPARLKKNSGGVGGGRSPPHLQTQRRYDVSERVHMGSVFAGKMLKKGEPPLQLETDCLYDEFWKALKQFCVWCKSSSWYHVLESKPAQPKKKAGGCGGGG